MDFPTFFSEFFVEFIIFVILSVGGMVLTFVIGVHRANSKLCKQIETSDKNIELIKKCMVIQSKMIDIQTKLAHPEAAAELEEVVKEMLFTK